MSDPDIQVVSRPVFARCVRCDYSLRGLPRDHACPECGLRFDDRCALYRVTNPKAAFFVLLSMSGSAWIAMRGLAHIAHWTTASWLQRLYVVGGLVWVVFVGTLGWVLYRLYRRGQLVAVTGDGLIVRMVGFKDELIPWTDIAGVEVKPRPEDKPQIATLRLSKSGKRMDIGGTYNVFPTTAHVDRFIRQVNDRIRAAAARSQVDEGFVTDASETA